MDTCQSPVFPAFLFQGFEGFCTITSTYKGLCGDSCWPDRAFNSKFPTSIPAPFRWGSPLGATIIQHFRVAHKTLKLLCLPKTAKALFLIPLMTTVISRRNWEQLQNLAGANYVHYGQCKREQEEMWYFMRQLLKY